MNKLYDEPVPGIRVVDPENMPLPGEQLLGYELIRFPDNTYCGGKVHMHPRPSKMTTRGWMATIFAGLMFFPIACVPCFMTCSYDTRVMRPVYGTKEEAMIPSSEYKTD